MTNIGLRLNARSTARPLRVVYLVDVENCPDGLIDAIEDEAYSRWGGRRTLIVPAKTTGIDQRYDQWVKLYDADIIYSYVSLEDGAVEKIHKAYSPAYLTYHNIWRFHGDSEPNFNPELPFAALNSLSVVPAMLGRSWGPFERPTELRILDKYFDRSESRFLQENFGFIRTSFRNSVANVAPDLYKCTTLISQASLDNGHFYKDPADNYVTDELAILAGMSQPNPIATLSELSDLFTPYLQTNFSGDDHSLSLIVGDSVSDRLMFWNGRHRYGEQIYREITSLRVETAKCQSKEFLSALKTLIERRGRTHQGHHHVILRSSSLSQNYLGEIAATLRGKDGWLAVEIAPPQTHASCIPEFRDEEKFIGFVYGHHPAPRISATSNFQTNELKIPLATPWHINEARPPASIRTGRWMIDRSIERLVNHSKYSNVTHEWVLPRRLRLQSAFKLTRHDAPMDIHSNFIRTTRFGYPSVSANCDDDTGMLAIPADVDAFRTALCNEFEWTQFDKTRKSARSFNRYQYAEISDKGRYLVAVLGLFGNTPTAFDFLMNSYWRDIIIHLGGISPEKNEPFREHVVRTLKKRLSSTGESLVISSEDQWYRLARIAVQVGHKIQKEERFVHYGFLKSKWELLVKQDLEDASHLSEEDKEYYREDRHLDQSIQSMCDAQILFQGREWQCRKCYNKNWVSIEKISRTLVCEVCGNEKSAPVSGDWAFRLNNFLLEAYRDHGVEPIVWTLWKLSERARSSFYFAPSMSLWEDYRENRASPVAEIDALVVVDGTLYLCEAKAGDRISAEQVERLVQICARVRPDILLIACMDENSTGLEGRVNSLREAIKPTTHVEIMTFDPNDLREGSSLPIS